MKLVYVEARRATLSLILDSNEKYFFPLFHSDQSQLEIFYSFLFRTKSSEFEIDRKKNSGIGSSFRNSRRGEEIRASSKPKIRKTGARTGAIVAGYSQLAFMQTFLHHKARGECQARSILSSIFIVYIIKL